MNPLVKYYVSQAGRGNGRGDSSGIGPIYSIPPFVQRGHGIGSLLSGLFRMVRHVLGSGAKTIVRQTFKALGREALRTGGKTLQDIAENPKVSSHDIISKHVSESTQNIVKKLRGRGKGTRKRKRAPSAKNKRKSTKRTKTTKRDIFS
jgi:hypothetical protein